MKKLLILLMLLPMWLHGQVIPTTKNPDGSIVLSGKGSLGGLNDNVQLRRYKFPAQGNFEVSGYFRSISNKNSAVGFMFRNEGTATNKSLATAGVILQRDSLKCVIRYRNNTTMDLVASTPNISLPCHVKEEKNGNSLKYYYSKQPESATSINWILVLKVENVFTEWTGLNHNVLNPAGPTTATAVLASLNFKTVTLDTDTDTRPSCNNGGSFILASVTKTTGTLYNVDFTAANLTSAQVIIKNTVTNTTVRDITQAISTRPQSIDFGTLATGSYSVQMIGKSCKGTTNEKLFTVASDLPPPNMVSCKNGNNFSIASVTNVGGSTYAVDFNAANLSSTQVIVKNAGGTIVRDLIQTITQRPQNIDFGTLSTGNYTVQFVGMSCSGTSNAFGFSAVGPVGEGGGGSSGQTSFTNILKTVPLETQTDKFSVLPFAGVTTPLKNYDATRQFPKYPIIWHSKLDNFISANKKVWDLGISFPIDIKPNFGNQSGDGVLCVDYIRFADPNTGLPWANGIDPACNVSVNSFISARPFHRRAKGEGGTAIQNNFTNEQLYDSGIEYTRSDQFGYGDNVGQKTNTGYNSADVENGEHGRFEEIPIVIGMAINTFGHATSMYNQAINITFPNLSHYPLDYINGGYRTNGVNLDGTPAYDGNGNIIVNNVITEAWKPENKVTITTRGVSNKGLIDFENAKESSEVSCYASAAYFQGDVINYDGTNTRVTNKFGLNRNAEHIVAHTIYATQVRKWYLRKNFNDRGFYTLAKTLCDRGNIGLTTFNTGTTFVTNPALSAKHLPRKLAFLKTMFVPFEGSYFHHWDRNTVGKDIDGDNGDLAAINLIHQRKSTSVGNVSFVDLFDSFDFKLWTAEISYDGGTTWKQEKGTDYIMSPTSILHAQCITSNGIWAVLLGRSENTEAKSCKLRIMYNGVMRYFDVTPDMWETTNPQYATTPLANIPDKDKDYYYNLIDLNNVGGTSQSGTVVAPTITKNVANPTANQSVTFTSSGCQSSDYVTKWYTSDEGNLLATGLTFTVNAVNGNGYYAKCVGTSTISAASNTITFSIASNTDVTITEPNKPPLFFSNNQAPSFYDNLNNLPAIFQTPNNYDAVNDLVWLQNDKIKIGINLKRGGQIAWASLVNSTTNLVYNGYDGGFQIQIDAYQKRDGYVQNGKYSRARYNDVGQFSSDPNFSDPNGVIPLTSYNVTQGGDFRGYSQSVIDYRKVGTNGYYIKIRPLFYTLDREFSRTDIESTITLDEYAVKCDYKYTSFRTDGQYEGGGFDGGHAPVCFLVNNLTKYKSYTGNNPWTRDNAGIEDGNLPNESSGQTPLTKNSKERWSLVYNPANNVTIGVYANTSDTENSFGLKQKEVNGSDRQGGEFTGGYTILGRNFDLVPLFTNFDRSNFSKTISSYLIVTPDPNTFINTVYQVSGH